jgi:hypothetical protein
MGRLRDTVIEKESRYPEYFFVKQHYLDGYASMLDVMDVLYTLDNESVELPEDEYLVELYRQARYWL